MLVDDSAYGTCRYNSHHIGTAGAMVHSAQQGVPTTDKVYGDPPAPDAAVQGR